MLVELVPEPPQLVRVAEVAGLRHLVELGREGAVLRLSGLVAAGEGGGGLAVRVRIVVPERGGVEVRLVEVGQLLAGLAGHLLAFGFLAPVRVRGEGLGIGLAGLLVLALVLVLIAGVAAFLAAVVVLGEAERPQQLARAVRELALVGDDLRQLVQDPPDLRSSIGRHSSTMRRADGGGPSPVRVSRARSRRTSGSGACSPWTISA